MYSEIVKKHKYTIFDIIFIISFLSFLSSPSRNFFLQEQSITSLFSADTITIGKILIKLLFIPIPLFLLKELKTIKFNLASRIFFLYVLISAFSILYSTSRSYSLMRLLEIVLMIAVVIYLRRKRDLRAIMQLNYLGFAIIILLLWIVFFLNSEYAFRKFFNTNGYTNRFGGYILHPNTVGALSGILTVMLIWRILTEKSSRKAIYVLFAVITSISLILTLSRTAILASVLSIIVMFFIYNGSKKIKTTFILLCLLGITCIVVISPNNLINLFSRGDTVTSILTGTGRTLLWSSLFFKSFSDSPIIGHGFQNIISNGFVFDVNSGFSQTTAHNAFLQVLLGVGILGFIPFLISYIILMKNIIKNYRINSSSHTFSIEILGVALFLTINSITELGFGGPLTPLSLLYFTILFCIKDQEEMHK